MDHKATDERAERADEHGRASTGERPDERPEASTDASTDASTNASGPEPSDASRDDLRITVEPGVPRPVHPDDGRTDVPGEGEAALGESSCPHRVRVRDLTAGGRLLFTVSLIVIAGAGIVQLLALFLGGFLLSIGAEISGSVPVAYGVLLVLGAMLGMIGVFALVGTWRRLHRPEAPITWLTATGTLLTAAALLLTGTWVDFPVAAVGALPSGAVAAILIHLRTILAPRETCEDDPALPVRALAWLAPHAR